ncbi:MAG: phosphopantothenoylcysteine decarboxylase, partial [Methylocystis sp.]
PVALADPAGVATRHVETAREMLAAVEAALPADIFIGAAAVADWRVEAAGDKMKKTQGGAPPALSLVENPDILASVASRNAGRPALVVGFAAETSDLSRLAKEKLARKGCDLIVANDVSTGVFGSDENEVHIVTAIGVERWPRLGKTEVALRLVERLSRELAGASGRTRA